MSSPPGFHLPYEPVGCDPIPMGDVPPIVDHLTVRAVVLGQPHGPLVVEGRRIGGVVITHQVGTPGGVVDVAQILHIGDAAGLRAAAQLFREAFRDAADRTERRRR